MAVPFYILTSNVRGLQLFSILQTLFMFFFLFLDFLFSFLKEVFTCFWLRWVSAALNGVSSRRGVRGLLSVAAWGLLSIVAARGLFSLYRGAGLLAVAARGLLSVAGRGCSLQDSSRRRARALRVRASAAVAPGCPEACGIFLDGGWNLVPCIGRWILNRWRPGTSL